jgi:biopolymer transport protein ExbB
MPDILHDVSRFATQGGAVILALIPVAILLWFLIVERYWFIYRIYPEQNRALLQQWLAREETASWYAQKIREAMVAENRARLKTGLPAIGTLIAICPLLGLLGTVTGMVTVFDTIALTGTSDARAMADGIYRATLPTMSGLVLALSAMYCSHHLQQKTRYLADTFADRLGGKPLPDNGRQHNRRVQPVHTVTIS